MPVGELGKRSHKGVNGCSYLNSFFGTKKSAQRTVVQQDANYLGFAFHNIIYAKIATAIYYLLKTKHKILERGVDI